MAMSWAAASCKVAANAAAFQEEEKKWLDTKFSHRTIWPKPGMKELLVCGHFCGSSPHVSTAHVAVFIDPPPPSHGR